MFAVGHDEITRPDVGREEMTRDHVGCKGFDM